MLCARVSVGCLGKEANMAKYLAAEASWKAADMCMQVSAQNLVPGKCERNVIPMHAR